MSTRWVGIPDQHLPHKCALTGRGGPDSGPYLELDFRYFDANPNAAATGELRLNTLYLSESVIREALNLDGAPFVAVPPEDLADLNAELDRVAGERDVLAARVTELEAGAPVTMTHDELRLLVTSSEQRPASNSRSTDPDHHEPASPRSRRKAS